MDDDLRADLSAAIDATPPETGPELEPAPAATPEAAPEAAPPREGRDSLGRFIPKAGEAESGAAPTPTAVAGLPSAAAAPELLAGQEAATAAQATPAPSSWGPAVREHWGALPAAVQQQVAQREADMQRFVSDTAFSRQAGDNFMRAVQPFMPAIQAEGVDPITAVTNLMQFATRMRLGTPSEKAQTLAKMVNIYGVDIGALDGALAGAPQAPTGPDSTDVQAAVQQALAPLLQAAQQRQQASAQQAEQATRTEIGAFAASAGKEFFSDLRGMMADIIEVGERNGQQISLQDAYDRAAMLHPEVSKVMIARRQGVNAHQLTQAAQRARSAAVSVRGAGAPVGNPNAPEPSSMRESIEAAIESHSRV